MLIFCFFQEYVTGPKCDQCKPNSFYLNENNRYGCIDCFCMGITRQCTSSNWYRQQVGMWTKMFYHQNDVTLINCFSILKFHILRLNVHWKLIFPCPIEDHTKFAGISYLWVS